MTSFFVAAMFVCVTNVGCAPFIDESRIFPTEVACIAYNKKQEEELLKADGSVHASLACVRFEQPKTLGKQIRG